MSAMPEQDILPISDCWNRIGVWGKQQPRCQRLDTVVHCRNCDLYSNTGRLILQRVVSVEQLRESTQNLAHIKTTRAANTDTGLCFRIGNEWLMLNASRINEITPRTRIHRLPHHTGSIMLGLANVRGELKVCIGLSQLLGIESGGDAANDAGLRVYPRMLVAGNPGAEFVFPVDEVRGTYRYSAHELHASPATVAKASPTYTRGVLHVDDLHIACLDDELLFYSIGRNLV